MRYRNLLFVFLLSIFGVIGSFSESNANERKTIALVQQIGNGDFDRGLNHIVSLAKQGNSAATFLYANLFFETGNLEAFRKYLNLAAEQETRQQLNFWQQVISKVHSENLTYKKQKGGLRKVLV